MRWEALQGDGNRVRYCGRCKLDVYNLAEMKTEEVAALVQQRRGRLCGRLYVREDRTATLLDCPEGLLKRTRRRAIQVAVLLLLGIASAFSWKLSSGDRNLYPVALQRILSYFLPPAPRPLVGDVCVPPPTRSRSF